jgi:hypothetical protein
LAVNRLRHEVPEREEAPGGASDLDIYLARLEGLEPPTF